MELYYSIPIAFGFIGLRYLFNQLINSYTIGEKSKVNQFSESCFKGIYHTTAFCIGYNYVLQEDLLNNIQNSWVNLERQHIFDYYYLFELSWYIHELICHFFAERKKDNLAMLIHHVATITLIALSYQYNVLFIGTLITTLHNLSDIFLHGAKITSHMQYEFLTVINAILMLVSWIYSRLYIYPFYVIKSVYYDSFVIFTTETYVTFVVFLLTLQILHVYWFQFICLALYKKIHGQQMEDTREKND